MADLSALLRKVNKGAAAESTLAYFGELLDQLSRDAASALENARGDEALRDARADFKAIRRLFRKLDYDIKDGHGAQKDLDASR